MEYPKLPFPQCGHRYCAPFHCQFDHAAPQGIPDETGKVGVEPAPATAAPSFHDFRDRGDPEVKVDRFTPNPIYEDKPGRGRT